MVKSLESRLELLSHPKAQELIKIIIQKRSNLCVSADVTTCNELIDLVQKVGPYVCMVKTHIDIVSDFTMDVISELKSLATKHNFLIFEDRKFADLGSTVQKQFSEGVHKISSWSDFVNAHVVVGPGIITGLKSVSQGQALILIAQMSAAGNLCDKSYTTKAIEIAKSHKSFVCGFICTESVSDDEGFLNFVPGVNISSSGDSLGQQYVSPHVAVQKGADVIIVGRGIYAAKDPAVAARVYMDEGFKAYQELVQINGS